MKMKIKEKLAKGNQVKKETWVFEDCFCEGCF
jgi:hypothetical protein